MADTRPTNAFKMMSNDPIQPSQRRSNSFSGLQIAFIVVGSIGLLAFGLSIGFTLGYCVYDGRTLYGSFVQIPANFGLIFYTSRAIFLMTDKAFPNPLDVQGLHRDVGGLLSFTLLTFSVWVTGTVWFVEYGPGWNDAFIVFFGCGFSWVLAAILTGLAGGVLAQASSAIGGGGGVAVLQQTPATAAIHAHQYTNQAYQRFPHARPSVAASGLGMETVEM